MERIPKRAISTTRLNVQTMFVRSFIQEVETRDRFTRSFTPDKSIGVKYNKLLTAVATRLWKASVELNIPAMNLMFTFLNRAYPVFTGKKIPVSFMPSAYEDFMINLSQEPDTLIALNYDESRRHLVCNIIKELQEAKKSNAIKKFIETSCKGYKVVWPDHWQERTRLFETILIMLRQLEDRSLWHYVEGHAMALIKAHLQFFVKWGDPIKLTLGCFIGENAMIRLAQYKGSAKVRQTTNKTADDLLEFDF